MGQKMGALGVLLGGKRRKYEFIHDYRGGKRSMRYFVIKAKLDESCNDLATQQPVGSIMEVFRDKDINEWLQCDGRLLVKWEYPDLYKILAKGEDGRSLYGEVGFKWFYIPNMREK